MEVIRMDKGLIRHICIKCADDKEQMNIGNDIHMQLCGKKDYIDNNIILNIDSPCDINIYIYEECEEIPTITI